MLWEFIAVFAAGFAAAGIALSLRLIIKRLPRWIVPVFAGLGMLGFAVYSEYHWFEHTASRLPAGTVVVATVPHTAFYKPWSYVRPQILQFVALDKNSVKPLDTQKKQVMLYFFERRMKAHPWAVIIDCQTGKQAHAQSPSDWHTAPHTAAIAEQVCP
ncbi:MAG: hypothetical protein Q4B88_03640 [Moraxella sp.]|nr:hypothetical protein [Moraxella sp.]